MSEVPATVLVDYTTGAIKTDSHLYNLGVISRQPAASPEARIRKKILRPDAAYALETSRRSGRNPARYSPSGQCMSAHMLHRTRPARAYTY